MDVISFKTTDFKNTLKKRKRIWFYFSPVEVVEGCLCLPIRLCEFLKNARDQKEFALELAPHPPFSCWKNVWQLFWKQAPHQELCLGVRCSVWHRHCSIRFSRHSCNRQHCCDSLATEQKKKKLSRFITAVLQCGPRIEASGPKLGPSTARRLYSCLSPFISWTWSYDKFHQLTLPAARCKCNECHRTVHLEIGWNDASYV